MTSSLGPGAYFGFDLYNGGTALDRSQKGRYNTELFTTKAIAMLESRNQSRRTFLYLAYNGVHNANPADPLQAPSQYIDRFSGSIPCDGRSGNNLTACTDRRYAWVCFVCLLMLGLPYIVLSMCNSNAR